MFDIWTRPGDEMPRKKGGVTSIAFDPIANIVQHELLSVQGNTFWPVPLFTKFLLGLGLARELAIARSDKRYEGYHQVVITTLFFKSVNDQLAGALLMRAGYSLQAFPCLRASFEACELMEYLHDHPDALEDYIRGRGRFKRDTSWVRNELPDTETRRTLYDFLNYLTHSNFKGLNTYTSYDADHRVSAIQVGPIEPRYPALVPYPLTILLLAYATRTLWKADESAAPPDWVARFQRFDEAATTFLSDMPSVDDHPNAARSG